MQIRIQAISILNGALGEAWDPDAAEMMASALSKNASDLFVLRNIPGSLTAAEQAVLVYRKLNERAGDAHIRSELGWAEILRGRGFLVLGRNEEARGAVRTGLELLRQAAVETRSPDVQKKLDWAGKAFKDFV